MPQMVSGQHTRPARPARGVVKKNTVSSSVFNVGTCRLRVSMYIVAGGSCTPPYDTGGSDCDPSLGSRRSLALMTTDGPVEGPKVKLLTWRVPPTPHHARRQML